MLNVDKINRYIVATTIRRVNLLIGPFSDVFNDIATFKVTILLKYDGQYFFYLHIF